MSHFRDERMRFHTKEYPVRFCGTVFPCCLLVLTLVTATAQDSCRFPFRPGNFLRYAVGTTGTGEFLLSFQPVHGSLPEPADEHVLVLRTGTRVLDMANRAYARVAPEGILQCTDSVAIRYPLARVINEFFPVVIPAADTMTLRRWYITKASTYVISEARITVLRRFDTTLFGSVARAFRVRKVTRERTELLTLADGYGIVAIDVYNPDGTPKVSAVLSGWVIDGRRHNWDPVLRNFLPLCDGDVHQASVRNTARIGNPPHETTFIISDTVRAADTARGHQWFRLMRTWIDGPGARMRVRSDSNGTFTGTGRDTGVTEELVLPNHAVRGCVVLDWEVTDVRLVTIDGIPRTSIALCAFRGDFDVTSGDEGFEVWTDGIGLTEVNLRAYYSENHKRGSFAFARVCGTVYGTPLSQRYAPVAPGAAALEEVYPHPIERMTGGGATLRATLAHAGSVTLVVVDLHGARVATLYDGYLLAGEHLFQWESGPLPAGLYVAILRAGHTQAVRTLILR
ncbi:MAG: hypothetical protein HY962_10290 [Ignavibacteriae bacterium]|nr:hypothetical protein [Ignavibacteriota bacterium]